MPPKGRITVGFVAGPHGIKGEIRLKPAPHGAVDERELGDVFLRLPDGRETAANVTNVREGPRGPILKFKGVDTRNDAEALQGTVVEIDRSQLPPIGDDEFFIDDLIGLTVKTVGGDEVGKVSGILPTAAHDLLVIDGSDGEILVPAVPPIMIEVDFDAGVITIDPPEGLLELGRK